MWTGNAIMWYMIHVELFGLVLDGNGLFVYDVANGQMKHIVADSDNAQSQIGLDFLQCVIEDHSGNIWVSSEYTGVSRLEGPE